MISQTISFDSVIIDKIQRPDRHIEVNLNRLIYESNRSNIGSEPLKKPDSLVIRAGLAGGLPFNTLTTDIVSGCLPARHACYGICFAAKQSWKQGIDFGTRVLNHFDSDIFRTDLERLPETQGYVRNGWNSDPSWAWKQALTLAEAVQESGRLPVFITKAFTQIDARMCADLAKSGAEIRVSISAFDNHIQLTHRMQFILNYRKAGGIVVPILMSAKFKNRALTERQDRMVDWLTIHDLPAAENSLRFPVDAPVTQLIEVNSTRRITDSNDVWSGRLYADRLVIPTTTTVPDSYRGLGCGFLSKLNMGFVQSLFHDPVKTHEEVMESIEDQRPPAQCGVGHVRPVKGLSIKPNR
ncbi:MAG: hypothetical protein PPHEMADM_5662 [uncultured Paraburkholderia sp.]|nr:MAG: hypothetical protein PPHEMADE_5674 [uncultured Paraburkholderia sp.]CAH2945907.1 MAG: hypothetical protein PPHEMADM_5662 [uncultured Paraburkholderia sp.]